MESTNTTSSNSRQLLRDFSDSSTLHGFQFVVKSHSTSRRLIWLGLMLTGFGALLNQLIVSSGKLMDYKHVIAKESIFSEKLTFPAVTFCNINMMKKSKINGTDAQIYLNITHPGKYRGKIINNMIINGSFGRSFDIRDAFLKYGYTAKEMIYVCRWNGKPCSYLNFTSSFSYRYGRCYTFNSAKDGHSIVQSTTSRKHMGLTFAVNIQSQENYGLMSSLYSGIVVVVHDQHERHMIEDNGMEIKTGFVTNIKLKRNQVRTFTNDYSVASSYLLP
ncbi:hypothetical protein QZH41_012624 [Actinostola sp. cb2023]|nr:hypothetical protein QZH41_012624 [Actinostola sp. cb2023]